MPKIKYIGTPTPGTAQHMGTHEFSKPQSPPVAETSCPHRFFSVGTGICELCGFLVARPGGTAPGTAQHEFSKPPPPPVSDLPPDETAVLELIRARMAVGRKQYGPLVLKTDKRKLVKEAIEEVLDAQVYLACRLVQIEQGEAEETTVHLAGVMRERDYWKQLATCLQQEIVEIKRIVATGWTP
jgi:hypothetical protein